MQAPKVHVKGKGGFLSGLFSGGKHKHKANVNVAAPTLDLHAPSPVRFQFNQRSSCLFYLLIFTL